MDNSRLDQLISDMAHSGVSHTGIIRALVTQGYDAGQIQERLNELYYAGALTPDQSDELRHAGVHELKKSVSDEDVLKIPYISRLKKCALWIQLHPLKTVVWLVVTLTVVGGGIGGYNGYVHAPLTVMTRMAQELSRIPLVAFTITKTASESDAGSYTLQGVVNASGQESVAISFASSATGTPWQIEVIRGADNVTYMRLISGPAPYPFLYNTWISIDRVGIGAETLSDLGLADLYDYLLIPKTVWSEFSLPGAYQSILVQPQTSSCSSVYSVLFAPPSGEEMPFSEGPLGYARSLFTGSVWNVCVSPTQALLSVYSGDFFAALSIPATIPSFSIDTQATPIETIGKWIAEENSKR